MKKWEETDGHGATDSETDSDDNGDDCYEAVLPTLNRAVENTNQMVTCLERYIDSEHLHLLRLTDIKH